jgi:CDP-diacylglycerol--serine O-phosphatidyltransferase
VISANPPMVLFGLFVVYSLSGYALWAWNHRKPRPAA